MLTLRGRMIPKTLLLIDLVRNLWRGVSLVNDFVSLALDISCVCKGTNKINENGIQKMREPRTQHIAPTL